MKDNKQNPALMELIDELATQITECEFKENTNKLADNGDWVFQEQAQDFYNEKYDEFEGLLNKFNICEDEGQ